MARKVVEYTVEAEGRDKGKKFEITEMPASKAERWAMRAFLAMSAAGLEIPDEAAKMGLAGLAQVGIAAIGRIPWDLAEPLLAEMFECVRSVQPKGTRELIEDDVEEVATRLELRRQVLMLHTDFFTRGGSSTLTGQSSLSLPPTPQQAAM